MPILTNLAFSKYHGAGNDFLIFDDRDESFPLDEIPRLCDRKRGIGADGLILLRDAFDADAEMVFFNADGSSPPMCGNGLRCFAKFLIDKREKNGPLQIKLGKEVLTVKAEGGKISTLLPFLAQQEWKVGDSSESLYLVNTGVPHVVLFPEGEVDVDTQGRIYRRECDANVNFVWRSAPGELKVRTYERGVERETLACGSGAAAVAYVANRLGWTGKDVRVLTESGEFLEVQVGCQIEVAGPAVFVFEGVVAVLCVHSEKRI